MPSKQKILIVDDDENIAELISLYLIKECYETKIVHDGESALLAFPAFGPNLILLDLMLPGIDGYQVCRELRKDTQVPIIMLSAKGEIFDTISSSPLTPRNWSPGSRPCCAVLRLRRLPPLPPVQVGSTWNIRT